MIPSGLKPSIKTKSPDISGDQKLITMKTQLNMRIGGKDINYFLCETVHEKVL